MRGSSSRAAPAPVSSFRTARPARSSRFDRLAEDHAKAGKRRDDMDAAVKSGLVATEPPRFPALAVRGLAGSSFKHEHLAAILEEGRQRCFFEVMPRTTWEPAGRRIACCRPFAAI